MSRKNPSYLTQALDKGRRYAQDNWQNVLTGLGTSRDKTQHSKFVRLGALNDATLSSLYHGDDMAERVAAALPRDMMREGYDISGELGEELGEELARLGADAAIADALIWARVYGGCAILIGADDGLPAEEALNERSIRSIGFLKVVDRRDLHAHGYVSALGSPDYGEPETYRITSQGGGSAIVHRSRLLIFQGAHTDARERAQLGGWSHSVFHSIHDELRRFNSVWQSAEHLVADSSQGVFKISGLLQMIAGGGKGDLQTRMEVVEMGRSVARAIMLDADEGEDFRRESASFTDLQSMMDKFMLRFASAAEMPVTRLMGQSPAGMNATGESDFRMWYDRVAAAQRDKLRPHLERLTHLLLMAHDGPSRGGDLGGWSLTFRPLWQPTEKESAETRDKQAAADLKYVQSGVLLPEEVALSRFRAGGWSGETEIDRDARSESLEVDERTLVQAADVSTGEAPASAGKVVLAPTDIAIVVTVDEARASQGLAPWPDKAEGRMTVAAFKALKEAASAIIGEAEGEAEAGGKA